MINKLVQFLKYIDLDFSKSFLGSQSTARHVLKDRLMSLLRRDINLNEFQIIQGNIILDSALVFDTTRATQRGNGAINHSLSYRLNDIPREYREIILRHKDHICKYLGNNFLYESVLVFRTMNMPIDLETYDVYSNIWHQDSHDGDRLLKIFILLSDVAEDDGPFTYLDREGTLQHWAELAERWDFSKFAKMPKFPEEKKVTGKRGDYLIINTANCMHRGSIPRQHRDMMQITLYPSWRRNDDRLTYFF